jgi:hypothetical protein
MFVILGKVKPGIESIKGLNLAVVKHTTAQVTRLSEQKLLEIGQNLLYWAWTDRGTVYIVYIFLTVDDFFTQDTYLE